MNQTFEKAYTINEVSKQIGVPAGTLRQWEKDLKGLLVIPRAKNGARYYTNNEIFLLQKIKEMRDDHLSKTMIRKLFEAQIEQMKNQPEQSEKGTLPAAPVPSEYVYKEEEQLPSRAESFKAELLEEIRNEIRNGLRKEVLEEVKKEISKGALHTVKSLSDSIYKSGENTKAEIQSLSGLVQQTSEQTSEAFETLSKRVAKTSKRTSEHYHTLSKKITDSSEASSEEFKTMIHYISSSAEVTSSEISSLIETLNTDREIYIETMTKEREQYWRAISEREEAFQGLIGSFRQTAAASEPKKQWWKIW